MNRRSFIQGLLAAAALSAVPFTWTYRKVSKVFTGARARIFINGKEVAFFSDVTMSINHKDTGEPIQTIGRFDPVELTCKMTRVSEVEFKGILEDDDEEV